MKHTEFKDIVLAAWNIPIGYQDSAKTTNAKFKNVRRALKLWAKNLPCIKTKITRINDFIFWLDLIEEFRDLSLFEWNCRALLKEHLLDLLDSQKIYWRQRGKINWVKLGDESSDFFS